MKKLLLTTLFSAFPLLAQATAQPSVNIDTLKTMTQIQQQQLLLQQRMQQMQNQLVQMQQQQLRLKQSLLNQVSSPTAKNFKWLTMAATSMVIPTNRINAGLADGEKVYICHAKFKDKGVHPGMVTAKGCLISYAGKSYVEPSYQILTGTGKIQWKPASALYQQQQVRVPPFFGPGPVIPPGSGLKIKNAFQPQPQSLPIIGGYEKDHNLYICRTIENNQMHVGKVVANYCNVGYQGKELRKNDYQVLFGLGTK